MKSFHRPEQILPYNMFHSRAQSCRDFLVRLSIANIKCSEIHSSEKLANTSPLFIVISNPFMDNFDNVSHHW